MVWGSLYLYLLGEPKRGRILDVAGLASPREAEGLVVSLWLRRPPSNGFSAAKAELVMCPLLDKLESSSSVRITTCRCNFGTTYKSLWDPQGPWKAKDESARQLARRATFWNGDKLTAA